MDTSSDTDEHILVDWQYDKVAQTYDLYADFGASTSQKHCLSRNQVLDEALRLSNTHQHLTYVPGLHREPQWKGLQRKAAISRMPRYSLKPESLRLARKGDLAVSKRPGSGGGAGSTVSAWKNDRSRLDHSASPDNHSTAETSGDASPPPSFVSVQSTDELDDIVRRLSERIVDEGSESSSALDTDEDESSFAYLSSMSLNRPASSNAAAPPSIPHVYRAGACAPTHRLPGGNMQGFPTSSTESIDSSSHLSMIQAAAVAATATRINHRNAMGHGLVDDFYRGTDTQRQQRKRDPLSVYPPGLTGFNGGGSRASASAAQLSPTNRVHSLFPLDIVGKLIKAFVPELPLGCASESSNINIVEYAAASSSSYQSTPLLAEIIRSIEDCLPRNADRAYVVTHATCENLHHAASMQYSFTLDDLAHQDKALSQILSSDRLFCNYLLRPYTSSVAPKNSITLGFSPVDLHARPSDNAPGDLQTWLSLRASEFKSGGILALTYILTDADAVDLDAASMDPKTPLAFGQASNYPSVSRSNSTSGTSSSFSRAETPGTPTEFSSSLTGVSSPPDSLLTELHDEDDLKDARHTIGQHDPFSSSMHAPTAPKPPAPTPTVPPPSHLSSSSLHLFNASRPGLVRAQTSQPASQARPLEHGKTATQRSSSTRANPQTVWHYLSHVLSVAIRRVVASQIISSTIARKLHSLPLYPRTTDDIACALADLSHLWTLQNAAPSVVSRHKSERVPPSLSQGSAAAIAAGFPHRAATITSFPAVRSPSNTKNTLPDQQPSNAVPQLPPLQAGSYVVLDSSERASTLGLSFDQYAMEVLKFFYEDRVRSVLVDMDIMSNGTCEYIIDTIFELAREKFEESPQPFKLAMGVVALRRT